MEEIEIMGRSLAEIKRIIAWYESLGSPSLVETDQERELRRKSYEEAKANYDAIPPNINANPLPTRSGNTRQTYIPEPSMGDQLRANLKQTLDTYCPYLPRVEEAVEIHPYDLAELLDHTVSKLGMDGKTEVIKCFVAAAIGPRGASTCVDNVWYRMNAETPRRPGPHTIV